MKRILTHFWYFCSVSMLVALLLTTYKNHVGITITDNNGSRWNTVWALVHQGTYEISQAPFPTANSMTVHRGPTSATYSSKPQALATWVAGIYGALRGVLAVDLFDGTWVFLVVLFLTNVVPFLIFLYFFKEFLLRCEISDWAIGFTLVGAGLGTYLTGFLLTLNNHLIAAILVFFVFHHHQAYLREGRPSALVWCGIIAGLAVLVEFSTGIFCGLVFLHLVGTDARTTCRRFGTAFLLVMVAGLYLEWRATGLWVPHAMKAALGIRDQAVQLSSALAKPQGMGALREPKYLYLFHITFGHHGFFLMTPLLLLGLPRAWRTLRNWRCKATKPELLIVFAAIGLLTAVTWRTQNYGGGGHGMRWLFWLIPLWLVLVAKGVDQLVKTSSIWKVVAAMLLILSCFNVYESFENPWANSSVYKIWTNQYPH